MKIRKRRNLHVLIAILVIMAIGSMRVSAAEDEVLPADIEENEDQSVNEEESGDWSEDEEESGNQPEDEDENGDQSTEAVGSIILPTDAVERDIISVDLPTLQEDEESPFDFTIDPQNLLFETDAALYGGGVVEEGANLLFHNRREGEFDFSRYSDSLCVTNRSTVPVMVTISAKITDADDLQIMQDKDFPEDDLPYVYLALIDDRGNEQPVSEDGEVLINTTMQRAPQNAYVYTLDPETGNYEYGLSGAPEDIDFDTYTFGLTGECNSNAEWSNISVHPKITVTWHVEPILEDKETEKSMIEEGKITDKKPINAANERQVDKSGKEESSENISKKEGVNKEETNKDITDEVITDKKIDRKSK